MEGPAPQPITFRQYLHFLEKETLDVIETAAQVYLDKERLEKTLKSEEDLQRLNIVVFSREWSLIHVSLDMLRGLLRNRHKILHLIEKTSHKHLAIAAAKIMSFYKQIEPHLIQLEKLVHLQSTALEDLKLAFDQKVIRYRQLRTLEKVEMLKVSKVARSLYPKEKEFVKNAPTPETKELLSMAQTSDNPLEQVAIGARMMVLLDEHIIHDPVFLDHA